jgi:H+/Cl- antiporter ClcA
LLTVNFIHMNPQTGKYVIIAGIAIVVIGMLIYFFHDKLSWLGRLPGDIRIEKENSSFYFPITTMIIISIVLTLLVNLFRRL